MFVSVTVKFQSLCHCGSDHCDVSCQLSDRVFIKLTCCCLMNSTPAFTEPMTQQIMKDLDTIIGSLRAVVKGTVKEVLFDMGLVITTSVHLFCGLVLLVSCITVFKCDKAFTQSLLFIYPIKPCINMQTIICWLCRMYMTFTVGMQKPFEYVLSIYLC